MLRTCRKDGTLGIPIRIIKQDGVLLIQFGDFFYREVVGSDYANAMEYLEISGISARNLNFDTVEFC